VKQETVMKLRFAFLAALTGACPALASPAGDIAGTWECRQPGVQYRNKPPILYVADAGEQLSIEVDGFSREIYGRSEVLADADGWFKVKPAQGQQFMIRPEAAASQKTASMGLRFADAKNDYRCLRLPSSGAATFAPDKAAPAAEGVLAVPAEPGGAPAAPVQAVEPMVPPGMQDEGAAKKPN
jgi:hypothetical protein